MTDRPVTDRPVTDRPVAGAARIRPATDADLPAIHSIVTLAYAHYVPRIGRPPAPMTADYAALIRAGRVFVAVHGLGGLGLNGLGLGGLGLDVLGLVVLEPRDDYLLLDNVAVAPAAQGSGVGALLLRFAEDRARELGLPEIRLYTNEAMTENLTYYPRRGYLETHRATADGFRRVYFRKPISGG